MLRLIIAMGISFALFPSLDDEKIHNQTIVEKPAAQAPSVSSFDTLSAVNSVIQDLGDFCYRNEEACITGNALIKKAHLVASATVKEFLNESKQATKNTISNKNISFTQ